MIADRKFKNFIKKLDKDRILAFSQELSKKYPQAGIFLVGGVLRDIVLNREPKDIDLIINHISFSELINLLAKYGKIIFDRAPKVNVAKISKTKKEKLLKENFGVLKFIPPKLKGKEPIDIAFPRTDNYTKAGQFFIEGIKRDVLAQADPFLKLEDDLKRRDFTINAMAWDIKNSHLIDPFNGISDLKKKIIKAVGDAEQRILKEDLSRAFRGLRFSTQLGFKIEKKTAEAIKLAFSLSPKSTKGFYKNTTPEIEKKLQEKEKNIRKDFQLETKKNLPRCLQIFYDPQTAMVKTAVAPEIMAQEFLKSLTADHLKTVELWEKFGSLSVIFPEVKKMKNIPQPREFHIEGDVYEHTILLLKKLPKNADIRLKIAALFHDIGKPLTLRTPEKDKTSRIRFDEHCEKGAEMTEKILRRLRMSKDIINPVTWAIKYHLLALNSNSVELKDSTIEKYFFRPDKWGKILLDLIKYDSLASIPQSGKPELRDYHQLEKRIARLEKFKKEKEKLPKPLINGHDLIKIGFIPGPIFSQLLDELRDLQLKGKIKTKKQAIEYLRKLEQ